MLTSTVARNIAANFGGSIWMGLMSLAFIPLYIRFMGIEAYGLVGFFFTLQAFLSFLDLGLATTVNREFARLSVRHATTSMRDLLRTLETVYWPTAVVSGLLVVSLSHVIAVRWLRAQQLPTDVVEQAVMAMGLVIIAQWPLGLYTGGLQGLQKQVLLSGVNSVAATVRGVGAVAVLWLVSPTIVAFFIWQIAVSLAHTLAVAVSLWGALGERDRAPRFDLLLLRSVWRFAAGMFAISVVFTALTQIDKLILSRLLSLEMFGYYTLAGMVAASLYRLVTPLFSALFPRFSQLASTGDGQALAALYHRSCQLMATIIVPAAIFIALFAPELLHLWTASAVTAERAHTMLSLLILGTALNGLLNLPYALQFAHGWTRLIFISNAVAVIVLVPATIVGASNFGGVGAAAVWLIYNAAAVLIVPFLMHRRLLPRERSRWYRKDLALPLAVASLVAGVGRFAVSDGSTIALLGQLLAVAAATQVAVALALPEARRWLYQLMANAHPLENPS
jgi:O-antigen/teichoic acid export membrane protein